MPSYYDEILKLFTFEDEEIEQERPRIEKAFRKLELGPADMKTAESWVRQNHDMELMGMRKVMRLWLKELIDLVLAKDEGKKIVYYGFPSVMGPGITIASASEDIYCACPDMVLGGTMGQIFNKLAPILEAGEKNGLPPGHGLCSLQQIRVGALAKGIIPVPDMVLTSSYYCDMGSKADELLHQKYGHPAVYVDGSMDSRWGEFPAFLPERVDFLGGQIEKALGKVEDILGVKINEEVRHKGISRTRGMVGAISELVKLMQVGDPQPISIVDVELARRLSSSSSNRRIMVEGPGAIAVLNQEVKAKVERGIGVLEKGAPRVMTFVAHLSDPTIMRMMESTGLSMPVTLIVFLESRVLRTMPFISGEILAERELARGQYHGTYAFAKQTAEAAREFNLDGVIWTYLFNCRPLGQPSHSLKRLVEQETGVPVLSLEFDFADSRTYSAAALRTRVETFAEILRARKASIKV